MDELKQNLVFTQIGSNTTNLWISNCMSPICSVILIIKIVIFLFSFLLCVKIATWVRPAGSPCPFTPDGVAEMKISHLDQTMHFNSLAYWRRSCSLKLVVLNLFHIKDRYILRNCHRMNDRTSYWRLVNIGSGNGLVPSSKKPLPRPMLSQFYVAKWHH